MGAEDGRLAGMTIAAGRLRATEPTVRARAPPPPGPSGSGTDRCRGRYRVVGLAVRAARLIVPLRPARAGT